MAAAVQLATPDVRSSRLVTAADCLLVGYSGVSAVIAVVAWQRDEATAWPATWIGLLLVTNALVSLLPARRRQPVRVEVLRAAAGALLAPAAYLTSARPFGHWWPGFVLMALVGSFGVAMLSTSPRIARGFSLYYLVLFVASAFLADDVTFTRGWVVGGGIAIAAVVASELISRLGEQLAVERAQRAQIEGLMHRVFPVSVAESLGRSGRVVEQYAEASILFADIVGFSPMVAAMPPTRLLALLDGIFSALDDVVDELGLEKIKTIGLFDLWGDAVNVASRMESHGQPGTIQITEATHALVADRFQCVDRGVVDVKGKGPMRVWHVVGRLTEAPGATDEIDLRAGSEPTAPA